MPKALLRNCLGLLCALLVAAPVLAAQKITVAVLPFVSSAPLFIAKDKGYYAAEGLDVHFRFFHAAQPVAVAVTAGDADFGVTGLTAGFYNLAGKGALQIIAAQSREQPGYDFSAYLVSNKAYAHGFTKLSDFPGHSFGMTQVGSTFHYMLGQLADKLGFSLDKVRLKPLQSVPNMIAALKSGQVDSIIIPAHIANPLVNKGLAHRIGWVWQETPWQLGALFTSTGNVKHHRAMVAKFVHAYQRACADYHKAMNHLDANGKRVFGPDAKPLIKIIMRYVPHQTPAKVKAAAPYIDAHARLDVGDIYHQVTWYQQHGLVDKSADPKSFINLSFVKGNFNVPAQ